MPAIMILGCLTRMLLSPNSLSHSSLLHLPINPTHPTSLSLTSITSTKFDLHLSGSVFSSG